MPESRRAGGRLDPAATFPVAVGLRLHHVGEVRAVFQLELHLVRVVGEVLQHKVFVDALGHEPITTGRHGRRPLALFRRRADDARRVVVDPPAGQRLELVTVEPDLPAREMAHVLVEEAFGVLCVGVPVLV